LKKVWDWTIDIYNDDENKKNISIKFIEDYLEEVLMIPLVEHQKKVCSAGTFTSCSIGVTGDILPCHQRHSVKDNYEKLVMGNILTDDDIKQIEFNNCTIEGAFDCNTCIAYSICKGGCPSENYTRNGNGNKMNEVQCMITSILAGVAYEYQLKIMSCSNIRSHRLNVLSQNLNLMRILFEDVLSCNPLSKEYVTNVMYFYEKLIDMEDILLPSFSEVLRTVIKELVNNNMELINMIEGENNEL
jgi:radical SAM protein with 4Fe4S-binding SPASM domain